MNQKAHLRPAGITAPPPLCYHHHIPVHAGSAHRGIQDAQGSQLEGVHHRLQSMTGTAYMKMQPRTKWPLVAETSPSHPHLHLDSTVAECEENSMCHRYTVDTWQCTETTASECMPSTGVVSHRQAESAPMVDWEDGLHQEVYHRQILLQQQLLLQQRRQQQQRHHHQQQQQQQPSATGELLMPLHSYAWRLESCKDESMMGPHHNLLQDCHQPEILHCLGAGVQLFTGGRSDLRSASADKTGDSVTPERDSMASTGWPAYSAVMSCNGVRHNFAPWVGYFSCVWNCAWNVY